MRTLLALLALALPSLAQDSAFDRKAIEELLAKKNIRIDGFGFDFAHLDSMPKDRVASFASTNENIGHLAMYRRVQKAPLSMTEEFQKMAAGVRKGDWLRVMTEATDRAWAAPAVPEPVDLLELPEPIRKPVGSIVAAIGKKDAGAIWAAIMAARPALEGFSGKVEYAKDGVVVTSGATPRDAKAKLTVRFGGDDVYEGPWAGTEPGRDVSVLIDTGGKDTYRAGGQEAAQGGAQAGGIAILVDLAGNDSYIGGSLAQGAGVQGTGILLDAAGDDRYEAENFAQGAAFEGLGALIDLGGNDTYLITSNGQAYGGAAGFGLLYDEAGDDAYTARDPLYGHEIKVPAPQDPKHNASMAQGAGQGRNQDPYKAGGIGLLLDARGDDTYRAGCWAQGVGYFLGMGGLLDLEGCDEYQSWVYVMGSGAHGGFGLQIDARGDDTYRVGGWNSLAMAVDYGAGFFLDAAGNDRYEASQSGHGCSIGLGIAIFQDSAGDDVYAPKDRRMGHGEWYEREDYNGDGSITPAEKRHWGLFLDLSGSDRYPLEYGNAKNWNDGDFAGGLDRASAKPEFTKGKARDWEGKEAEVTDANWESLQPADLLKLMKGDAAAKIAFAFQHGLVHEGSELLSKLPSPKPQVADRIGPGDRTYQKELRLWLTKEEAVWAPKILSVKPGAAPDPAWPAWVRREAAYRAAQQPPPKK